MIDRIGQPIYLGDMAIYAESKGFAQGINLATVVEIQTNLPEGRLLLSTPKGKPVACKALQVIIYKGYGECLPG